MNPCAADASEKQIEALGGVCPKLGGHELDLRLRVSELAEPALPVGIVIGRARIAARVRFELAKG
jgi:hypothetical protein